MGTRIAASPLPDVTAVSSAPRPTATPASVPFADILAGTVVRGAEGAVNVLPGGPLMAVALRGGMSAATTRSSVGLTASNGVAGFTSSAGTAGAIGPTGTSGTPASGASGVSASPEGPSSGSSSSTLGSAMSGALAGATGTGSATDGTGATMDSSLAQSQQQNMYYLQIQEQVNQENRSFSTLSNVLKAEHDTMKTAIGNIH